MPLTMQEWAEFDRMCGCVLPKCQSEKQINVPIPSNKVAREDSCRHSEHSQLSLYCANAVNEVKGKVLITIESDNCHYVTVETLTWNREQRDIWVLPPVRLTNVLTLCDGIITYNKYSCFLTVDDEHCICYIICYIIGPFVLYIIIDLLRRQNRIIFETIFISPIMYKII